MQIQEYIKFDSIGLSDLIKKKKVHVKEIIDVAIKAIELYNPKINAVIHKMYDKVEKQIKENHQAPLFGVPFLIKD